MVDDAVIVNVLADNAVGILPTAKVPPPRLTALLLAMAVLLLYSRRPVVTVVLPVKPLLPLRISVPVPTFVRLPPLPLMVPLNVVLLVLPTVSVPLPRFTAPPVVTLARLPTCWFWLPRLKEAPLSMASAVVTGSRLAAPLI
jgi:hypothetical protein